MGKRAQHEPYAHAYPSQLADCGHQAETETNGAGSIDSNTAFEGVISGWQAGGDWRYGPAGHLHPADGRPRGQTFSH